MITWVALVLGLLTGLVVTGRLRPLLLERWHALPLLAAAALAGLLPPLLAARAPEWLWTGNRLLLLGFIALRHGLLMGFVVINLWPRPISRINRITGNQTLTPAGRPRIRWFHRILLLAVSAGLAAEACVLLLNHGFMPIPKDYLDLVTDPATVMGIQNQALLMKQLIGPATRLPWLGQIWHWPLLQILRLSVFPFISPAEVWTTISVFQLAASQFFGDGQPLIPLWRSRANQQAYHHPERKDP